MDALPRSYICPLSGDVMTDPVTDPEGNSYEKSWILQALQQSNTSPITRTYLVPSMLIPNRALKDAIEQYVQQNPGGLRMFNTDGITTENHLLHQIQQTQQDQQAQLQQLQQIQQAEQNPTRVNIRSYSFMTDNDLVIALGSHHDEPIQTTRVPVHICCVVDVSGSMSSEIKLTGNEGVEVSHGFTRLDIVKHALKTILSSLQDGDIFSVVKFDDSAETVIDKLRIDERSKINADQRITNLRTGGTTNLWGGILSGLNILNTTKNRGTVNSMFLLTDGMSNVNPPRGIEKELDIYANKNGLMDCVINTFGFSYEIDSLLLRKISSFGHGSYSFIPDGSFVGTTFINALANTFRTIATRVKSTVFYEDNTGVEFNLGSLMFEQDRVYVCPYQQDNKPISILFEYFDLSGQASLFHENLQVESLSNFIIMSNENRIRLNFVKMMLDCVNPNMSCDEKITALNTFLTETLSFYQNTEQSQYIKDLLLDADGQVREAFSRPDWYSKWGQHYVPSLACAHYNQMCNNFKDPGVQHYTCESFERLRDLLNDMFNSLPVPVPSLFNQRATQNWQAVPPPINMSQYNDNSTVCFDGDCLVAMHDGSMKKVKNIRVGDKVLRGAVVTHVVKSICKNNKAVMCVIGNLLVTEWHPIRTDKWIFPADVADVEKYEYTRDCLYNFALDSIHVVTVNDIKCATLGHNFTDNDVISHDYFGTDKVINDLNKMEKDSDGCVVVHPDNIKRDSVTGKVVALF